MQLTGGPKPDGSDSVGAVTQRGNLSSEIPLDDPVAAAEARALAAEHELLRERDRALGLLATMGRLQWEAQEQRRRAEAAERALAAVTSSVRYRVGRMIIAPGTAIKQLRGYGP